MSLLSRIFWLAYLSLFTLSAFAVGQWASSKLSERRFLTECQTDYADWPNLPTDTLCASGLTYLSELR